MTIKITKGYPDRILRRDMEVGEVLAVEPQRAMKLIKAGVAAEVEPVTTADITEIKALLQEIHDKLIGPKEETPAKEAKKQ